MTNKASAIEKTAYDDFTHRILPQRMIDKNHIFYHYCSPATAALILQNKTIRFSDIALLNDAEEAVWGEEHVFLEVLRRIDAGRGVPADFPQVGEEFVKWLKDGWNVARRLSRHFAACFSIDGDSLSQWRAYASDGEGFALGFGISEVDEKIFSPMVVEYQIDVQVAEMFESIFAMHQEFGEQPDRRAAPLIGALIALANRSIAFKNPAFRDEKEVRLISTAILGSKAKPKMLRLTDRLSAALPKADCQIKFEARGGLIVPYIDIPFTDTTERLTLKRVTLGPKCKSSTNDVELMLETLGFHDIEISVAGAAYR